MVNDSFPKVKRAIAPELIMWENMGEGSSRKCYRYSMITLLSVITIIGLCIVILFLNAWSNVSSNFGSNYECT